MSRSPETVGAVSGRLGASRMVRSPPAACCPCWKRASRLTYADKRCNFRQPSRRQEQPGSGGGRRGSSARGEPESMTITSGTVGDERPIVPSRPPHHSRSARQTGGLLPCTCRRFLRSIGKRRRQIAQSRTPGLPVSHQQLCNITLLRAEFSAAIFPA